MNAEFWVAFGTGVVGLIALITSSASAAKARVKAIEDAYVARYWQILDRFPAPALVAEDGTACNPEELKAVRLYLRLCEDELELRQLGWVGGKTWQQWRPGIQAQLNQWPVVDEWAPSATTSAHPTSSPCCASWAPPRLRPLSAPPLRWPPHAHMAGTVSASAKLGGVERKFLYRVFNGAEWYARWPTARHSTADRGA